MSDKPFKFTSSFLDSNPCISEGFENLTDHISKSFELLSSVVNILELKIVCYDNHSKSLLKLSKNYSKTDKTNKFDDYTKALADTVAREGELNGQFCENLKKESMEPLKETLKSNYEKFKKKKTECVKFIKERKNAYESATKSCKSYTAKYRAHEALVKKHQTGVQDDKTISKISKSQQGVRLAEKEARVSIEMLNTSLLEYQKEYHEYCKLAENIDRTLLINLTKYLRIISQFSDEYVLNIKQIFNNHSKLADETDVEEYMNKFIREKGTTNIYYDKSSLLETGEDQNKEFTIRLGLSTDQASITAETDALSRFTPPSASTSQRNIETDNGAHDHSNSATNVIGDFESGTVVVALFDYTAQHEDELTFHRGDTLTVVYKEDSDWYMGKLEDGNQGIFPANYVAVQKLNTQ